MALPRLLVHILVLTLVGMAVVVGSGAAQEGNPQAPAAADTLKSCLDDGGRLSVLVLMDESKSLSQGTDRSDDRVPGLKAALTGLTRLSGGSGAGSSPQVEVMFAGFSSDFTEHSAWEPVTPGAIDGLLQEADRYADRDQSLDTDYGTALLGARRALGERAAELTAEGGPPPCLALLWFTDGKFDISDRIGEDAGGLPTSVPYAPGVRIDEPGGGDRAVAEGRRYLCNPGGLMDALNRDGVVVFTVGLATNLSAEDNAFLEALTTGGEGACGSRLSDRTGSYLSVTDSSRLFFLFGSLTDSPIEPGTAPVCAEAPCPDGKVTFDVPEEITNFVIQAVTGGSDQWISLRGPANDEVTLEPGGDPETTVSGIPVGQVWLSPRAAEVTGSFESAPADAFGPWAFAFVAPPGAESPGSPAYTVRLVPGLDLALTGTPSIVRGETTSIEVALVDTDGARLTSGALFDSAALSAQLRTPGTGTAQPVTFAGPTPDGTFTADITLPVDESAPELALDVRSEFPTSGPATVTPVLRSFRLPTTLPADQGYPTVSPAELSLPSLTGGGTTRGVIEVTGSASSGGCVRVGDAAVEGPAGAGPIEFVATPVEDADSDCLPVGAGETRTIDVAFTAGDTSGAVRGEVPITLRSDLVPDERAVSIPVYFALAKAPDVAKRTWITGVLVLIGAVVPLLLLHLLNVWGARFRSLMNVLYLAQDVRINSDGRITTLDGGPPRSSWNDFSPVPESARNSTGSRVEIDGLLLRAVASGSVGDRRFSLFRGPYGAVLSPEHGVIVGAPERFGPLRSGRAHEVPLALPETWIFVPFEVNVDQTLALTGSLGTSAGGEAADHPLATGRLILIAADGRAIDQGDQLLARAESVLGSYPWAGWSPPPPVTTRRRGRRAKQVEDPWLDGGSETS